MSTYMACTMFSCASATHLLKPYFLDVCTINDLTWLQSDAPVLAAKRRLLRRTMNDFTCLYSVMSRTGKRRWLLIQELKKWGNFAISIVYVWLHRGLYAEKRAGRRVVLFILHRLWPTNYMILLNGVLTFNASYVINGMARQTYGLLRWTLKIVIIFLHKICTMHLLVS